jgi:hypothetical protein
MGSLAIPVATLYLDHEQAMTVSTYTKRCFLGKIPSMEFKIFNIFIDQQPQNFEYSKCRFDYQTPQYALAELQDAYGSAMLTVGEAFKLCSGAFYEDHFHSGFNL